MPASATGDFTMRRFLLAVLAFAAALYLWNASWLAGTPDAGELRLIAHRGVHQIFDRTDLANDTCTAERIFEPSHGFLENTLPSMRQAFAAGADVVEIDVHPTTDGQFAVMHDWTLDCRTEGTGPTREHDMAYLKSLDVGYGYTADGGKSFPFRGKGTGLMPSLRDVVESFPDRRFLINFKSREAREGEMLARMLTDNPQWRDRIWAVYGGDEPTFEAARQVEGLKGFGSRSTKQCLIRYLALGWSGYVPQSCRNTYVMVPGNIAWLLWGWPNRFHARMERAGSGIILLGPYSSGDPGTSGIDRPDQLSLVPPGFDGYIWTNRIEDIGPMLR